MKKMPTKRGMTAEDCVKLLEEALDAAIEERDELYDWNSRLLVELKRIADMEPMLTAKMVRAQLALCRRIAKKAIAIVEEA